MALGQIGLKQHRDKKLLLLLGLALLHLKRSGEPEGKSAKELQVSRCQGVVVPLPNLVYCSQSQTCPVSKYTVLQPPGHTVPLVSEVDWPTGHANLLRFFKCRRLHRSTGQPLSPSFDVLTVLSPSTTLRVVTVLYLLSLSALRLHFNLFVGSETGLP